MLVEAALAAAVIGIGLVFISRAFASSLRTLQAAHLTETALSLAQQKLTELEVEAQTSQNKYFTSQQQGTFAEPHQDFDWMVTVRPDAQEPGLLPGDPSLMVWTTVIVTSTQKARPAGMTLATLMPRTWIPPTGWDIQ